MEPQHSPVYCLDAAGNNSIYIKRDDLLPYSFGGNKARKAWNFFREIDSGQYDCVVTYGSGSSNHCRVIANMSAERCMDCYIISAESTAKRTFNTMLMEIFGAAIKVCPTTEVHHTIEATLEELRSNGRKPYFIPGGGHGNIGTQAYVDCYREILKYEKTCQKNFDFIFHATGTGTTQAGLICGKLLEHSAAQIVGISIARKNPYGRNVVLNSVKDYLASVKAQVTEEEIQRATIFEDFYVKDGYGKSDATVRQVIREMMKTHGIPMDSTYVGKAYAGMLAYIEENQISGKNILFIHTGGTPLFFDDMRNMEWQ